MKKDVMILTGAGQIGMAIARRTGYGMKIIIGDKKPENGAAIARIMNEAGFDTEALEMDLSSRESIKKLIAKVQQGRYLPYFQFPFFQVTFKNTTFGTATP